MRKLGQRPGRPGPRHRAQRRGSRLAIARPDHHAVLVHIVVTARPHDLAALELEVPLAGPWRQVSGADPAAAVADDDARKQDRGDRGRRAAEVGPARIPRFAEDALRLGVQDQAKQVEVVDGQVDQQGLLLEVVAAATRRSRRRETPEIDRDLVQLAQGRRLYEFGDCPRRWKVAVVLADHQDESGLGGHVDQLVRGAERRRERLLDQDVQPGVKGGARHGHMTRQRGGVEERIRPRGRDRLPDRFEVHTGRRAKLFAGDVQRVRIRVDVRDEVDLVDVWDDAPGPVAAVPSEANLHQSQRRHGRQSCRLATRFNLPYAMNRADDPRPNFRRSRWMTLNGEWQFGAGIEPSFDRRIVVPFCAESELSGVHELPGDVVWYRRRFDAPAADRLLLHFGAVDYRATVWVNDVEVARHEGGHGPFTADITEMSRARDNQLVVRAEDPLTDKTIPRGKQYWGPGPERIFYTPTTGIWQPVWLEPLPDRHITGIRVRPDFSEGAVHFGVGGEGGIELVARLDGEVVGTWSGRAGDGRMQLDAVAPWSPDSPVLYDLEIRLLGLDGVEADRVESYFGMRKIETRDGQFLLNGEPYVQRLVLDQGYFPGGGMTAARDEDLGRDVELAKT